MADYPQPIVSDFNDIVRRLQGQPFTPVAHLLDVSTTAEATESEQNQIREVISSAAETIESIDTKIYQARLLLEFLHSKKESYESFIGQHKALIAPVNLLPPEILSKIFMDIRKRELRNATVIKPTITTRISRRWRYIALQTPQLWSTIGIRILDTPDYSDFMEHQLQSTKDWLDRSTGCPLTLRIISSSEYYGNIINEVLIAHANRWQTLILEGPLPVDLFTALQDRNEPFPMLQSCKFGRSQNLWTPILPGRRWEFLLEAEKIRHIAIQDPVDHSLLNSFPLSTVTFLDTSATAPRLHNIFNEAKRLRTLCLEFHDWRGLRIPLPSPHNLTFLHLDCIAGHTFLQRLPLFPSLRRLFLFFGPSNKILDPEADFLPLFRDSGSNLEHLTLSIALPPEIFAKCFEYTPKVKVLHIHCALSAEIIQQLTLDSNYEGLVRHLHTLNLSGKIEFSPAVLKAMLRSRGRVFDEETMHDIDMGLPSLRLVQLMPDRQHATVRDEFSQFVGVGGVNAGMNVRFRGHDWNTFANHQYADANGDYESRQGPWLLA